MRAADPDYEFETHPILTWGAVGVFASLTLFGGLMFMGLIPNDGSWMKALIAIFGFPAGLVALLVARLGSRVTLKIGEQTIVIQEFRAFRWRLRVIPFSAVAGIKDLDWDDYSRLVLWLKSGKSVNLGMLNAEGRKRFLREFPPVRSLES